MIKKVLVISDSHGRDANVRKVLRKEKPIDLLLHLGDSQGLTEEIERAANCPVIAVSGNCDLFCRFPLETIVRLGKHKALMVHGHNHFVSLGTDMLHAKGPAQGHGQGQRCPEHRASALPHGAVNDNAFLLRHAASPCRRPCPGWGIPALALFSMTLSA